MFSFAHLRTFFSASFVALVIVACGGSSGGASPSNPLADGSEDIQPLSAEVLGDDVDADGIRDDVQMMIETEYGGDIETLRAFQRKAVADQMLFKIMHDSSKVYIFAEEYAIATVCWMRLFGTDSDLNAAREEYSQMFENTPERLGAKAQADERIARAIDDIGMSSVFDACP